MIEIRINGKTLPVSPDITLTRDFESTIFNRDATVTDFTYPVDIPLTNEAIAALGLPHVIANPNLKKSYDAELVINGMFISKCKLRLLKTSLKNKTCTISIIGDYGSFASLVGDKKLNELQLGGVRTIGTLDTSKTAIWGQAFIGPLGLEVTYTPCTSADYMKNLATGAAYDDYVFYQAVDEKHDHIPVLMEEQFEYDTDLQRATSPSVRALLNPWYHNSSSDNGFCDPVLMYIQTVLADTFRTNDRYFWVPFFRVKFVLKKCFEEFGFAVTGNIINDPDFDVKTLYNTYAINECSFTETLTNPPANPSLFIYNINIQHHGYKINPQNHVPKIRIIDFLTEISKLFNLQYVIDYSANIVTINQMLKLAPDTSNKIIDLSQKAFPDPDINYEDSDFTNGYEFSFSFDENDGASGEDVKEDVSTLPLFTSVDKFTDLFSLSGVPPLNLAYVRSENAYYQFGGSSWDFYSHNLQKYRSTTTEQVQKIESKAVPVPMKRFDAVCRTDIPYAPINSTGTMNVQYLNDVVMPYSSIGIEGKNLVALRKRNFLGLSSITIPLQVPKNSAFIVSHSLKDTIQPHVCNWLGMARTIAGSFTDYPVGATGGYDGSGQYRGPRGLYWFAPSPDDGLYHEYWKKFVEGLAAAIQVDFTVLWDVVTYKNTALNQVYIKIDALYYLCRKANINMPFPNTARLTLVRV
jgi:hypothetical protein